VTGARMLHPKQFEVNEAWVLFRVNDAPITTDADGDCNVIALMDAASCYLLRLELVPIAAAEPTRAQFRRMLQDAQRHKQQLPKTLLVAREDVADLVTPEATEHSIDVVRVPENELLIFTSEARQAFWERFEDPSGESSPPGRR
jgi:hypothetical protein